MRHFVFGVWAPTTEQNLFAQIHTNSHKFTLSKVTRSLFWQWAGLNKSAKRGRGRGVVVEEVRLRSVFDTDLNPQLSVSPFQGSNNTGAKRRKSGFKNK